MVQKKSLWYISELSWSWVMWAGDLSLPVSNRSCPPVIAEVSQIVDEFKGVGAMVLNN